VVGESVDERIRRKAPVVCPYCHHNVHACDREKEVMAAVGYVVGVNHAMGVTEFTHEVVEQMNRELRKRGSQLQVQDTEVVAAIDLLKRRKVLSEAVPWEPIGVS